MAKVMTVCGEIGTEQLGSTLMHEHIFASSMGIATHYPQFYRKDFMEYTIEGMKELKANGISTIVEATPVCLGRDVRNMKAASEASGVNVIATTGWWGAEPPYLGPSTAEQWAQCFLDDMTIGCDGTDIKAGILKAAMDVDGPTEWKVKIHHAVGMVSKQTGAHIMLHTYCPKETPRHQLAALKEEGVDMNKVVVDHIPETTDMDFIQWIYDQGVWIGIDRLPIILFPGEYAVTTETRIKTIKKLIDAGMADRILFSHDVQFCSTLFDNQTPEMQEFINAEYPDGMLSLKNRIFPKLAEMGCDPDALWQMTIENPKKFFES